MRHRTRYLLLGLFVAVVFAFGRDVLVLVSPDLAAKFDRVLLAVVGPGPEVVKRTKADVPRATRRLVVLVAGQSNAGNWGEGRSEAARPGVLNLDPATGALYRARDPMAGADGMRGSFMPTLGDMLVDAGVVDSVVFIPIAIGSTSISDWTDGPLRDRLAQAALIAHNAGLDPDLVLWQQGESDALSRTGSAEYTAAFGKLVDGLRKISSAPVFVALASHCGRDTAAGEAAVRAGQGAAVSARSFVFAGPDLDTITARTATDDCHMSEIGLKHAAAAWAEVITRWSATRPAKS